MIVRIDDYPAGIRPIQPGQLDMFDRMLNVFMDHGVTIHLGIVPQTYEDHFRALSQSNIVPCMHGVEHGYKAKSKLLKNDPTNIKTIGVFDEFDGWSEGMIFDGLVHGKAYLESVFLKPIETFIPCCNKLDLRLAELVKFAGFKSILCEHVCESPIPITPSGFYGKLDKMNGKHSVVTLHIPWEWDTVMEKGFTYWEGLVYGKL